MSKGVVLGGKEGFPPAKNSHKTKIVGIHTTLLIKREIFLFCSSFLFTNVILQ